MKIVRQNSSNSPRSYYPVRSILDDFFSPTIWDDISVNTPSANVWEELGD